MKTVLISVAALCLALAAGRSSWEVRLDQVRSHIVSDAWVIERSDEPQDVLPAMLDVEQQIHSLRTLARTCPLVLACTPTGSAEAERYLALQEKRAQLFEKGARIALRVDAMQDGEEMNALRDQFLAVIVEYRKLLPEIDAIHDGVPSAIAQALEALR